MAQRSSRSAKSKARAKRSSASSTESSSQFTTSPDGSSQIQLQPPRIVTQEAAAPLGEDDALSKMQIRDRLAHGGMSDLERQHLLATDVFLSDEDRTAYQRSHAAPAAPAAPPLQSREPSLPPTQGANTAIFSPTKIPSGPIAGPDALGFEGALAPQGLLVPKGLLASHGFMGPQGLLAPRSERAAQLPSAKPPASQASTKPPHGAALKPEQPRNAPPRPSTPAPASTKQLPRPSRQAPPTSPTSATLGKQTHFQTVESHFSPSQNSTTGAQNPQPSLFSKASKSPFAELFERLIRAITQMLGLAPQNKSGRAAGPKGPSPK